jgi:excinuclease ABC subunit A
VSQQAIELRGVAVNNLRQVDLDLPHRALIVFCGVSGSGKTSMALDTLYAEGQRRYIESFSAYTRQFLEQLDKPQADRIDGIPPAIAVTHKNPSRSNRATVGTTTEVNEYLALLFARAGEIICYQCGQPVRRDSPESAAEKLSHLAAGTRVMIGFDATVPGDEPADHWIADLVGLGYVRAVVRERTESLEPSLAKNIAAGDRLTIILDRLSIADQSTERLRDSIESAFAAGEGGCVIVAESVEGANSTWNETVKIDDRSWQRATYSNELRCETCGIEYPEPEPQLFNFNRPLGACPECEGFGNIVVTDMDRVVPDPQKSLRDGAIAPWNSPSYAHELAELLALASAYKLPVDVPYAELSEEQKRLVVEGVPERSFGGLNGFFQWLERRKYKMHLRVFLSRWRSYHLCPACGGARLRPEALAVRVAGRSFADVCRLKIDEALQFFDELQLPEWREAIAKPVVADVRSRLSYLADTGVGYLAVDRSLRTLSSGEAQRVALTTTLGSNLVDMLYVLDEPSVGLHPADIEPLAAAVERLHARGNTVVVVEHEPEIIRRANQIVEFGPGAGTEGGRVIFQGSPKQLMRAKESRTGGWLSGRSGYSNPDKRRSTVQGWVKLRGARGNNLQNLTVEFPLGVLCLVTGVSGAGKSTLVDKTLYPALARRFHKDGEPADLPQPLECDDVLGTGQLDDVVHIDQSPIGRSPRSNPATYIKALDPIRTLFAEQLDARTHGLTASHFSFNVEGGRCDTCNGDGYLAIDMQFMANVYMKCPECGGKRFRQQVLEVRYRGLNIAEVLDMTAREAFNFFRSQRKVQTKLKFLLDVGLDYLRLGQPANTLSGGESQRLKLAAHLAAKRRGRTLFLLDEPTTGLHFNDIVQLLDCFDALLEVGHSLVVVEHNLQLMKAADWVIDLGPGAAEAGGRVVATGTPEEIAACAGSATGRVLAAEFAREQSSVKDDAEEESHAKAQRRKEKP